jgi:hypothetical protein
MTSGAAFALPLNGIRSFEDNISGHSIKTYTEDFLIGFPVNVILDGYCNRYSDVNLNLYVYNMKGNLIKKSESPTCYDQLSFTPESQTRFEIVVRSEGSVADMKFSLKIEAEFGEPGEQ